MDEKPQNPDVRKPVEEAHSLLTRLRETKNAHPELDEAIEKLEMALSILTTNTGGML